MDKDWQQQIDKDLQKAEATALPDEYDVYNFGEGLVASGNLVTMGFTFELKDGTLESIEIGIHGELGVYSMHACKDFEEIIDFIIGKLVVSARKSTEAVMLVSNLIGTSEFLMGVFLEPDQAVAIENWGEHNDKIVQYAFTQLGDRTMFNPLSEVEQCLNQAIAQELPVLSCVESFTRGCAEAARVTQHMVLKSGRASYAAASESPESYNFADPGYTRCPFGRVL